MSFRTKSISKIGTKSASRQRAAHSSVIYFPEEAFIDAAEKDTIEEIEIDLEEVIKEETIIFEIHQAVKEKQNFIPVIKDWWRTSANQCENQVQLFEGEKIRKLIRQYLIMFILTIGYLENVKKAQNLKFKAYSSIKTILTNIHRNYLVFVEFLNKNLSNNQKEKNKRTTNKLLAILSQRSTNKLQPK